MFPPDNSASIAVRGHPFASMAGTGGVASRRKWIDRGALAGLIAIGVASMSVALASAACAAGKALEQIAADQQQQQNLPPPQQKGGQEHDQQGGQQHFQGGQSQYQQSGQQHTQGGQWPYQQGGQQHNQSGGQPGGQQGQRYDWSSYQPGHQPSEWNRYHQNFDPRPYQGNWDAKYRYSWRPYVPPRGWYYQRWGYGQTLPPAFWVRDYWLDSYWQFGLMDPPYGFVWVRYGPDALLLDVVTGQILSAVYGVFYTASAPSDTYAPPAIYSPPPPTYSPAAPQPPHTLPDRSVPR